MVYLKNTVAKRIGFLALIWCYYSKHLGQSVSQSRILITSDTQIYLQAVQLMQALCSTTD